MSHNVFANLWQVAAKSGSNKSIARFPDVCMSPPSPPAGPIPIPYPDTSLSSDLKEGTDTVKVGGDPAALSQQSYYQPSALGNEAATRTFGASVITHVITGKTYFQAWSMDVKYEGKNVCRHLDITTSNHASYPGATPPAPTAEQQTALDRLSKDQCPCCGKQDCAAALSSTQKNENGTPVNDKSGKPAARDAMTFDEYFRLDQNAGTLTRRQQLAAKPCLGGGCTNKGRVKSDAPCDVFRVLSKSEARTVQAAYEAEQDRLRTHYNVPRNVGVLDALTPGKTEPLTNMTYESYQSLDVGKRSKIVQIDHTTPRAAGGCPTSLENTQPHFSKCDNCKDVDGMLDGWHARGIEGRRKAAGIA